MPTPHNIDVFIDRLERAGLLVFDPLIDELRHGAEPNMPVRTAQFRFVRAVGLPRRKLQLIERARHAVRLLRGGTSIPDVIADAGYYDQPQLTRALRQLIGHTPAEVARGGVVLGL
jgi:methylphosphotriester-DNA--protein-cysteine methyltransferase